MVLIERTYIISHCAVPSTLSTSRSRSLACSLSLFSPFVTLARTSYMYIHSSHPYDVDAGICKLYIHICSYSFMFTFTCKCIQMYISLNFGLVSSTYIHIFMCVHNMCVRCNLFGVEINFGHFALGRLKVRSMRSRDLFPKGVYVYILRQDNQFLFIGVRVIMYVLLKILLGKIRLLEYFVFHVYIAFCNVLVKKNEKILDLVFFFLSEGE